QDLTTLLSLLGGSTAGENRNSTIMAVIPRSSYEDFTRGLAQLGASHMEAERPSLPDPVHVAIRLARSRPALAFPGPLGALADPAEGQQAQPIALGQPLDVLVRAGHRVAVGLVGGNV